MNKRSLALKELGTDLQKAQYAIDVRHYDLAVSIMRQALAAHPENSLAFYTLARAYILQRKYHEAEDALQQSLRLDPSYSPTHMLYGGLLRDTKRYQLAEQAYLTAIELDPAADAPHFFYADFLLVVKKDLQGAREHCRKALELHPEKASYHDLLARISVAEGNIAQAEPAYLHALRLDPENTKVHNNYGAFLLNHKRDPKAAFEHFRLALMQNPTDATMKRNFLLALKAKHPFYWLFWNYGVWRRKYKRLYALSIFLLCIFALMMRIVARPGFSIWFLISLTIFLLYLLFMCYTIFINPLFDFFIKKGWIK